MGDNELILMDGELRSLEGIANGLDVNRRWLPPQPHAEYVLRAIEAGLGVVFNVGHEESPLVRFEDGGSIALTALRYEEIPERGWEFISTGDDLGEGQTKYRDVCSSISTLKREFKERPELVHDDVNYLHELIDNACYMIGRLHKRVMEYVNFNSRVVKVDDSLDFGLDGLEIPSINISDETAEELKDSLSCYSTDDVKSNLEYLENLAETIRDVAQKLEGCAGEYKSVAIKIGQSCKGKFNTEVGQLYLEIKGGRNWVL